MNPTPYPPLDHDCTHTSEEYVHPQRQLLVTYVRHLADHCALRDWNFLLSPLVCERGHNAQIAPVPGRRLAELRVSEAFFSLPPTTQRHALVHELLHCHMALCACAAQKALSKSAYSFFEMNLEYGIDSIADGWAQFFPLPCFGGEVETDASA